MHLWRRLGITQVNLVSALALHKRWFYMNVLCKRVLRASLLGVCRAQPKMSRKRLLKTND